MKAVVNSSICPLMSEPRYDCELADEALFGMVVEVLEKTTEDYWLVRTHYRYEGYAPVACLLTDSAVPFLILGNASNVVFDDADFEGAVLFTTAMKGLKLSENRMTVSAGTSLTVIAAAARDAGLSGAEFAYGIPASLGGAVYMNAGAFGGCMADICQNSTAFDLVRREVVTFRGVEQCFGYRTSIYEKSDRYVILCAELLFRRGVPAEIDERMNDYLSRRRRTQPLEYPSAGSVFKRPEGHFAGKLIEDCGLKGVTVGGAQVSEKHAGFIVNRGGATASDVHRLVELIHDRVLCETGVELECEIRFL